FNSVTRSMRSPLIKVAFHSSGSCSVREATNFGMLFTLSAKPMGSDAVGQKELKALVGLPPKQERIGRAELVHAAKLGLAGRVEPVLALVHDPVDRHLCRHDQSSHG